MTARRKTLALLALAGVFSVLAAWRYAEVRSAWVDYAARVDASEAWSQP
ncbi:MAG: hypothetical protein GY913_03500 [Proteobacteria bacterium]|nr:hypothetical protein [Pseudomonadota bacterium]MCP4915966.1 hypothetical protein [Pseudomonadota bacterium]